MANVVKSREKVNFGFDDIVISKYVAGVEGGMLLPASTSDFPKGYLEAGHPIIIDSFDNHVYPLGYSTNSKGNILFDTVYSYLNLIYDEILAEVSSSSSSSSSNEGLEGTANEDSPEAPQQKENPQYLFGVLARTCKIKDGYIDAAIMQIGTLNLSVRTDTMDGYNSNMINSLFASPSPYAKIALQQ